MHTADRDNLSLSLSCLTEECLRCQHADIQMRANSALHIKFKVHGIVWSKADCLTQILFEIKFLIAFLPIMNMPRQYPPEALLNYMSSLWSLENLCPNPVLASDDLSWLLKAQHLIAHGELFFPSAGPVLLPQVYNEFCASRAFESHLNGKLLSWLSLPSGSLSQVFHIC